MKKKGKGLSQFLQIKAIPLILLVLALPVVIFLATQKTNFLQHANGYLCTLNTLVTPTSGHNAGYDNPTVYTYIVCPSAMNIKLSCMGTSSNFTYTDSLYLTYHVRTSGRSYGSVPISCTGWAQTTFYHHISQEVVANNPATQTLYTDQSGRNWSIGLPPPATSYSNWGPCAGLSTQNSVCTSNAVCPSQFPHKLYGPGVSKACTHTCCTNLNPNVGPCAGQSTSTSVCTELPSCPNQFPHKLYGPGVSKACTHTCCSSR